MRGAVMHGPGEVRVEEREAPEIVEPTDAIIRVSAACVCGSDLWPYRGVGVEDSMWPMPMGHEYAGIVDEVGDAVTTVQPGQFVVGSFWASDNTCEICRAGYQSACLNRVPMGALGAQADLLRVPLADGTLIATPDMRRGARAGHPRHRLRRRRRRRRRTARAAGPSRLGRVDRCRRLPRAGAAGDADGPPAARRSHPER
jgi:threonine dehydrogenase-like Zn-dependent dehydrogenase